MRSVVPSSHSRVGPDSKKSTEHLSMGIGLKSGKNGDENSDSNATNHNERNSGISSRRFQRLDYEVEDEVENDEHGAGHYEYSRDPSSKAGVSALSKFPAAWKSEFASSHRAMESPPISSLSRVYSTGSTSFRSTTTSSSRVDPMSVSNSANSSSSSSSSNSTSTSSRRKKKSKSSASSRHRSQSRTHTLSRTQSKEIIRNSSPSSTMSLLSKSFSSSSTSPSSQLNLDLLSSSNYSSRDKSRNTKQHVLAHHASYLPSDSVSHTKYKRGQRHNPHPVDNFHHRAVDIAAAAALDKLDFCDFTSN